MDTLTNTSFEILDFVTGNYNVSVVDDKGCPYDTLIQIAEPDEIVLSFDDVVNSTCFGSNNGSIDITHTGGVGELIFSWSKDSSPLAIDTVSATALSPGSYSIFVTDDSSCVSQTIDTIITEPSLLDLSIDSITNPLCFGSADGYISVSSVGGTLPYSYSWSGDTAVTGSDFLSNVSDGVYDVVLTDNNNCTDTISNITLIQPNQMSFINSAPIVDVECFGASTGQISVEVIGGSGPFSFSNSPNIGSLSTPTTSSFTLSDIPFGQYQISVIDSNACVFVDTFEIQQNTEIQAIFSGITPETCDDDNGQVTVTAQGGISPYVYDWVQSGQSSQTAIQLSGGENKFVNITDSNGCEKEFAVFVPKVSSVEIISINAFDNLCSGSVLGQIDVTVEGIASPFNYSLSGIGDIISSDTIVSFSNLASGSYNLTVTDNDGCSNSFSTITINESSQINISVDTLSTTILECSGDNTGKIFLNIDGGNPFLGDYYWLFVNDPDFSQL